MNQEPITIAVVLEAPGRALDISPLKWAVDQVNRSGNWVDGRELKLKFYGEEYENTEKAIWAAVLDGSAAVIGPPSSADFAVAGELAMLNEIVLVSPTSTAGIISRMFKGSPYIWRTTQSDINQAQAMILIAHRRGAERVALITGYDDYGTTFFDWFGFFAVELGLKVSTVERLQSDKDCRGTVARTLSGQPDIIFAVPNHSEHTVCIARAVQEASTPTQLFLSEAGMDPRLLSELGDQAEGIEGFVLTADPQSGFSIAYEQEHAKPLPPYGANMYDSVLLLAYGLHQTQGVGGEILAEAMAEVVAGRGKGVGWNADGIEEAIAAIGRGSRPDIEGASGSLVYPRGRYTDLQSTVYGLWRIENGGFVVVDYFSTGEGSGVAHGAQALFETTASQYSEENLTQGTFEPEVEATGLQVVIVAVSHGWENYRHQADALAQYQYFKEIGLTNDQIIMIGADDLMGDSRNRDGAVFNSTDHRNLYWDVEYDYNLNGMTIDKLEAILLGEQSEETPVVLESTRYDNLYIFFVGHGSKRGVAIAVGTAHEAEQGGYTESFRPLDLAYIMDTLYADQRFNRSFITIEACHGGVMGKELTTPGVLLMAAATENENSLSAEYDPTRRIWMADQFARNLSTTLPELGLMTFRDLFSELYLSVSGSHVTMANEGEFGDIFSLRPDEFFLPSSVRHPNGGATDKQ